MDNFKKTVICAFISASLFACGGGGGSGDSSSNNTGGTGGTTYKIESGAFQKGPFVAGTTVTIQELGEDLKPTGVQYTATTDDTGHFNISNIKSRFAEVFANGYYFDELTNMTSNAPITLRAILDLSESSSKPSINVLTTLQVERLRELVKNGQSFQTAKTDSKNSILSTFGIDANAISNLSTVDLLGLAQADDKLLRATIALLQSAKDMSGSTEANITTIVAKLSGDLKNDGLPNESAKDLAISLKNMAASIDITKARGRLISYVNDKSEPVPTVYQSLSVPELAKAAAAIIATGHAFGTALQQPKYDLQKNLNCTSGSFTISPIAATSSIDDGAIQYSQCLKNGKKWNGILSYQENLPFPNFDYIYTASNLSVENPTIGVRLSAEGEFSGRSTSGEPDFRSVELIKGRVFIWSGLDITKFYFPEGFSRTWLGASNDSGHGALSIRGGYATNCIDGDFSYSVVSSLHKADRDLNGRGGSLQINSGVNELGVVTFNSEGGLDVTLKNGSKSTISRADFLSSCGLQYDFYNSLWSR